MNAKRDFYITISPESSKNLYPKNSSNHFITQLPEYFGSQISDTANFKVALAEFGYDNTLKKETPTNPIFITCNLVDSEFVNGNYFPLLRVAKAEDDSIKYVVNTFNVPMYKPVTARHFRNIEIAIISENGKLVDVEFPKLYMTLHFFQPHYLF